MGSWWRKSLHSELTQEKLTCLPAFTPYRKEEFYRLGWIWFGETLWFWGKQIRDLCSEVMTSQDSVSAGGFVWWCWGIKDRGSLHLLTPTAWISMQGTEAAWSSPSLSFARFTFSICMWGTKDWLWDGLIDSPGGGAKLRISFRKYHHPFTHRHKQGIVLKSHQEENQRYDTTVIMDVRE